MLIILLIISLVFSGFFSGMEIAFVSANRLRIELQKKQGRFPAGLIDYFQRHRNLYISTMLVGNNIALVVYGMLFAEIAEPLIKQHLTDNDGGILFTQTILSTILILVTGEFLPKTIFRLNANVLLNVLAVPVLIIGILIFPISMFSVWLSQIALHLLSRGKLGRSKEQEVLGRIDLDHFLLTDTPENTQQDDHRNEVKIFKNALEFSETKVRECMIPRNEIVAIELNDDIDNARTMLNESGFSKLVVYKDTIDNIIGYVHTLEIFKRPKTIRAAMTELQAVPETMPANKLLNQFIKTGKNMVLVVDEFGGTSGIVTPEDVLEEIFGEIDDEFDTDDLIETVVEEGKIYEFSGRLEIDYLNEAYKLKLPESTDYETLAGYIFFLREEIPQAGDSIDSAPYRFEIIQVTAPKIDCIRLIIDN